MRPGSGESPLVDEETDNAAHRVLGQELVAQMRAGQLVEHLEETHHRYTWDEMPRLLALAGRVASAHGTATPELSALEQCLITLVDELEPHLLTEEMVLFPMIRELALADELPIFQSGSVTNTISRVLHQHERMVEMLDQARQLTSGYQVTEDTDAASRELFEALERFEADFRLHVHKERDLLFPTVVEIEQRLAGAF